MAAPKFLRNEKNGRVLPYTDTWAQREDMVPCDKDGKTLEGFEPPAEPTGPSLGDEDNGDNDGTGLTPSGESDSGDENPDGDQGGADGEQEPEKESGMTEPFDPESIIPSEGADPVKIDEADTATLSAYCERHFGEKIHHMTGPAKAAACVRELITENGHPDED